MITLGRDSTTFGFDDWGRMTSKARGSYEATYSYRYGQMLRSVTSDFPGEGNVTYEYGGDGKRRERTVGTDVTCYNYSAGWKVVSEEDGSNNLGRTRVGFTIAESVGSNPSTGSWHYLLRDRLGSIRDTRNDAKEQVVMYEFSPYGQSYVASGDTIAISPSFALHNWDSVATLYGAPFRSYSSTLARWTAKDPLGAWDGPNRHSYVRNNPINRVDPLGLFQCEYCIETHKMVCWQSQEHPDHREWAHYESDDFYSGNNDDPNHPDAMNNPDETDVANIGPIPPGEYIIGPIEDWHSPNKHPWRPLIPVDPSNFPVDRDPNSFFLHGPGLSEGCIACGSNDTRDTFIEDMLSSEEGNNSLTVKEHSCMR